MPVAENEIIEIFLFQHLTAIEFNILLVRAAIGIRFDFSIVFQARMGRPLMGESNA